MSEPFFFIHIPKTAGTSFRLALAKYFNSKNMLADYGVGAEETSSNIIKYCYANNDLFCIKAALLAHKKSILIGHVTYSKYGAFFQLSHIMTFVREPFQRVLSEYKHFVRHKNYTQSFNSFIQERRNINLQSRFLADVPLSMVGFVGLSEEYSDSLKYLNKLFNFSLKELKLNTAPKEQQNKIDFTNEDIELFYRLNQEDVNLYLHAQKLFHQRLDMMKKGIPYSYGCYSLNPQGDIQGMAYRVGRVKPLSIQVIEDGKVTSTVEAKEKIAMPHSHTYGREGFIGFTSALVGKEVQEVQIVVADSGQVLYESSSSLIMH